MQRDVSLTLRIAGTWLIFCIWASVSGWFLTAIQSLGAKGYILTSIPGLLLAIGWWKYARPKRHASGGCRGIWRRLRNTPAFAGYVLVSVLILIGAFAHAPTNHDGLTYRLPRVLYWWQERGWFWLDAVDFRMDIAGVGAEWMTLPLLLLAGTDRLLFLLNFIPFLLFPGLFFLAATGLGVSPRSARWWMWLCPLAYGLAMQAGSIGNDALGAALAVTSLAFASEARRGRPVVMLILSAAAAALMTGVKVTTIPLGLPLGAFWIWQAWRILGLKRTIFTAAGIAPVAVLCGFLPIALLCWKHTGVWSGNPNNRLGIEVTHPAAGLLGNGVDLLQSSLAPPVLPGVGRFDQWLTDRIANQSWYQWIQQKYPTYDMRMIHELPTEEGAGIGLGITIMAAIWCIASLRGRHGIPFRQRYVGLLFASAVGISVVAFLAKAGGDSAPRLMLPFTPLLIISLLLCFPAASRLPQQRWACLPAIFLLPTLVLNPNRPLLPGPVLMNLPGVPQGIKQRMSEVYSVYAGRHDLLASIRDVLPAGASVGYAGSGDRSPYSLFKPLGRLKISELNPTIDAHANWIVGTREGVERRMGIPLEEWEQGRFFSVFETEIVDKVSAGPETWQVWRRSP
jgi:hypothetical protein